MLASHQAVLATCYDAHATGYRLIRVLEVYGSLKTGHGAFMLLLLVKLQPRLAEITSSHVMAVQ